MCILDFDCDEAVKIAKLDLSLCGHQMLTAAKEVTSPMSRGVEVDVGLIE